jgi:RecB family exonuclease
VELTVAQRRTLQGLIGLGPAPALESDLADRVRHRLEEGLAAAGVRAGEGEPIWLGKHRLHDLDRCEGLFHAQLRREGPPFRHSDRTALGALLHAALELDVVTEGSLDPRTTTERAAARRREADEAFADHWAGLEDVRQAEVLAEAGRRLAWFRASFPPLIRGWAPMPEWSLRAPLAGGRVVLSGTPDLTLGRRSRLVIDFKTGRARPEYPEDLRFYALLLLLRTGAPPYRVATLFLDSGEWQAEDVTEPVLERAASRVVRAAGAAVRLSAGTAPSLGPGVYCAWCPRADTCPAGPGGVGSRRVVPSASGQAFEPAPVAGGRGDDV